MSRWIGRLAVVSLSVLAWVSLAQAQNTFPTPSGSAANGAVNLCPSAASAALKVPCDDTNPLSVKLPSGGTAVTVADGADVAQGTTTDAACATDNGTCTVEAVLKRIAQRITSLITALGTPFQAGGALGAGTANIGNVGGTSNVTPTDCSSTIAAGGTAQNAFTAAATRRGFTIANIDTTEVLWISFTTTAAASGTGSYPLAPATATTFAGLSSFTSPLGFGINTALSVIGATTSHKFSCTVW